MSIIGLVACWTLAGVFALTAVGKSRTRTARLAFRAAVSGLARTPGALTPLVATVTIIGEAAAAALLAAPKTVHIGLTLASALLVAFTILLVRAIRARTTVACNCFGPSSVPVGWASVARNLALLALTATGWWLGASTTGLTWAEIMLCAAGAGGLVLSIAAWDLVAEIAAEPRSTTS